jgi:hypothetical protein
MVSVLRDEPRLRVTPPYGGELASPKLRIGELVAHAEGIDQGDGLIRYADANMAARKATTLYEADIQSHFGQPNGG